VTSQKSKGLNYNAAEAGNLVSGLPGNSLSKVILHGEPDGTQITVYVWRIREYERAWTDIKGLWRQGQVEKLRCG
jgi:hypothetical protein